MTKRTNKEVLAKGIKFLSGSLPLVFIGPSVLFSAFNNREHPLYILVLSIGALFCLGAMFCIFYGLKLLTKALFDE
ncbi:drug/metabolite transporter (DMT)-like permease [Mesonia hippocampi]|uniref:Drug/metabolite transporter (DMT)-like permease n=1 Tax=Mesonia hippocampi TaxID=1628250 RepID=A0A840ESH1_9FLAO|nr:DUF6095 family protein [Mesonia hippocampi]MBB4119995.1 drug/metabolite transporter (DMT)-like permease [Mesonia hippocampi]